MSRVRPRRRGLSKDALGTTRSCADTSGTLVLSGHLVRPSSNGLKAPFAPVTPFGNLDLSHFSYPGPWACSQRFRINAVLAFILVGTASGACPVLFSKTTPSFTPVFLPTERLA